MLHLYLFCFLAGLLGTNGIPHFVKGITGAKHQTPFGKSSSAVINVVWGWLNIVVGIFLLHLAHPRAHELRALALAAIGMLLTGLVLAANWANIPSTIGSPGVGI